MVFSFIPWEALVHYTFTSKLSVGFHIFVIENLFSI